MRKETVKILFVCVENARRSQMARGFAEAFGKGKSIEVFRQIRDLIEEKVKALLEEIG